MKQTINSNYKLDLLYNKTLGKSNTSINVEEKMMISVILLVH